MIITDEMIDRFSDRYCIRYYDTDHMVISEEIADAFFREQRTEDVLDYVNSRKPHDEVYLTQAMIVLADRARMLEEWLDTFDLDGKLWEKIWRKLRKQLRTEKNAAESGNLKTN